MERLINIFLKENNLKGIINKDYSLINRSDEKGIVINKWNFKKIKKPKFTKKEIEDSLCNEKKEKELKVEFELLKKEILNDLILQNMTKEQKNKFKEFIE